MLDSGRKKPPPPVDPKALTVIGPGTLVTGEVKSKGTIHVEGAVQGRVESEDTIIVQNAGRVKADLEAKQIIISGEVQGNVFGHERLEITSSGRLVGDITAPRVAIAEGVMFEGSCTMKRPNEVKDQAKDSKPASEPIPLREVSGGEPKSA
jgi:cytoskeletal protein CcmA (bactofilin family)